MNFEWPAENIVGHLVAYLVRHPGKVHSALRCGSPLLCLMWHIVAIQCQKIFCDIISLFLVTSVLFSCTDADQLSITTKLMLINAL